MDISLKQTSLIRQGEGGNENLLRITLSGAAGVSRIYINGIPASSGTAAGETAEIWIKEPEKESEIIVRAVSGNEAAERSFTLRRPRHWRFYIEQHSHHDPGYTDLMSHVFRRHYEWIDALLD